MPKPLLSIVCPAWNEVEVLPAFHLELERVLDTLEFEYHVEIIYVDDGSTDGTTEILDLMSREDVRVRYISLSRNFGHQAALTAGLEAARGDVVISMDSDLQHPPALIPTLLAHWRAGNDVVLTLRRDDASLGIFKKLSSRLFYLVMRYCSGMDIRPAAADFRLLSRKALDSLLQMPERHRFLRGMVHWMGFSRAEVPFQSPPRFAGKSKYTLVRMLRLARDGLLSFSRVPLHAALLLAGGMIGLSFVTCILAWLLARPAGATGWLFLAIIFSFHLIAGAGWLALLAFSEYLARIHEQVLGRPLYVVRQTSEDDVTNTDVLPLNANKFAA